MYLGAVRFFQGPPHEYQSIAGNKTVVQRNDYKIFQEFGSKLKFDLIRSAHFEFGRVDFSFYVYFNNFQ